jgi:hypothetical protein
VAEHLPATVSGDPDRDHHGLADHPPTQAHLAVRRVEEQVREGGVVERSLPPGGDLSVELRADAGHLRLGDPGSDAQRGDQVVDLAGGHPVHVGLADHRVQRDVDAPARGQQGGEEAAGAQLRDVDADVAGGGGHHLGPGAVTPGGALVAALVAAGPDVRLGLQVHQGLQCAGYQPVDQIRAVAVAQFLEQGRKGMLVVGHRVVSSVSRWSVSQSLTR